MVEIRESHRVQEEQRRRKTGQRKAEVQSMVRRDEGEEADGSPSRFPGKITEDRDQRSEVRGQRNPTGGRQGQQKRMSPMAHGKGDREIQTEREKKKRRNALFLAPEATLERAPCRRQVPGGRCQYHNPS